ncbi:hypothetical protein [Brucella anthropi]|uniref:hypothetical protein n=1 Tax=Brucella anthropi TaxID=529 RepID=UPI000ACEE018|nr:hypothetical protein [Brucella anthropi]
MSDTRRVEIDTKHVKSDTSKWSVSVMRALADTHGMATNERAGFWLEKLMQANHRGPTDTWTAARDRVAIKAGIEPSMAKRIWQRWRNMTDVSGDTLLKLMLAYDDLCQRNDAAADHYKAVRLTLREDHETYDEPVQTDMGEGSARLRAELQEEGKRTKAFKAKTARIAQVAIAAETNASRRYASR